MDKGIIKGKLPMEHCIVAAKLVFNGAPTLKFHREVLLPNQIIYIFDTGCGHILFRFQASIMSLN